MFWKNWPTWLKGGIVTMLLMTAVYFSLPYLKMIPYSWKILIQFPFLMVLILITTITHTGTLFGCVDSPLDPACSFNQIIMNAIGLFSLVFSYFLVGALIGWLYGRFKNISKK
jgi:hypothetical protein